MAAVANKQYSGNILEAFLPKGKETTKSSSSQTTQTDVSAEGINELIKQMMESDAGLANILTGQQSRGLYNSTTAKLLADDLAARVAGKAAIAKAPTTVTQSNSQTTPTGKPNAKYSAGMEILGKLLNSEGGQKLASSAFDVIGSGIKSLFGMDGGSSSKSSGSFSSSKPNTYASDPYSAPVFNGGSFSGTNFNSSPAPDYFSTSIFGPKNNFGQEDDEFSLDTLNLGGSDFGFSSGLGMDGFDFSPFTLGDYSLMSSGGSSYKSTDSYSSPSFSTGSSGISFSGGSNGSSGLSFGFSF